MENLRCEPTPHFIPFCLISLLIIHKEWHVEIKGLTWQHQPILTPWCATAILNKGRGSKKHGNINSFWQSGIANRYIDFAHHESDLMHRSEHPVPEDPLFAVGTRQTDHFWGQRAIYQKEYSQITVITCPWWFHSRWGTAMCRVRCSWQVWTFLTCGNI